MRPDHAVRELVNTHTRALSVQLWRGFRHCHPPPRLLYSDRPTDLNLSRL